MTDDRIQELLDAPPTAAELHAQQIRDEIDALPAFQLRACLVMQRLEIERLRSHAITLAETARMVERDRCADIVEHAADHGCACSDREALAAVIRRED